MNMLGLDVFAWFRQTIQDDLRGFLGMNVRKSDLYCTQKPRSEQETWMKIAGPSFSACFFRLSK